MNKRDYFVVVEHDQFGAVVAHIIRTGRGRW